MAASKYLIDVFTRHQVYLERLKTGTFKTFDPFLSKIDKMIRSVLNDAGVDNIGELSNTRLNALLSKIRREEKELLGDYAKKLTSEYDDIAEYESSFTTEALKKGLTKAGAVRVRTNPAAKALVFAQTMPIQAVGQTLDGFMQNWTEREISQVSAVIRNAHAQGWTMQQTILAVRGTKANNYTDGVLARVDSETQTVVRTAIQHISNSARLAVYEANEDIVTGYRWISTLDNRTTQQCRSLDQRVFKFGKGPLPPIHPNCRSTTVPEIGDEDMIMESASRASKGAEGGQPVNASLSYYEWLKTQPASFQDTAIGPTRGKLFRDGGLNAEEFARLNLGRNFEPLTLPQMRELAPTAFERAGL